MGSVRGPEISMVDVTAHGQQTDSMATLTIRNLPDSVLRALRRLAEMNGRSVEDQVRRLLAETVADRLAACELIEASWKRQSRPTTADEIAAWLARSRP